MKAKNVIACATLWCSTIHASTVLAGPVNPEISVIGDTRVTAVESDSSLDIRLEEVEIGFTGPVNPYARAEVYLAFHAVDEVEIEEAKLLLDRFLPGNLGLTVGHYRLDFGQINRIHTHAYSFLDRPLMHVEHFGADGLIDTGARLDWIAPIEPFTLRLAAGLLQGSSLAGGHHHESLPHSKTDHDSKEHDASEEAEEEPIESGSGRLDLFVEPSETFSFLTGATYLADRKAESQWFTADLKAKLERGSRSSFVLSAEGVWGSLESEDGARAKPSGWFTSLDYRIDRRWNVGGVLESTTARFSDGDRTQRYGLFGGMALLEESTVFRLLARTTDPKHGKRETEVVVQLLFALGPHAPHRY